MTEARREVASFCGGAVSGKLVALRTTHDDALARHKDEVRQLKARHSQAEGALQKRLADLERENEETKAVLFSTIREGEKTLERERRDLQRDHSLEIKALEAEHQLQLETAAARRAEMAKEYDAIATANARKVDVISSKDKEICGLKTQASAATNTVLFVPTRFLTARPNRCPIRHGSTRRRSDLARSDSSRTA